MRFILKSFISLYAAVLILAMGLGLLATFLSVRLSIEGFSTQMTGLILTSYFIGSVVGTFFCSQLIRSIGHIRSFAAFAALATAMVMLHSYYVSAPAWAILRFFTGLSTIGLFMVIESSLNEGVPPQTRGRVFSVYMVIYYLGGSGGQQLLNVGNVKDQTLFFVIGFLLVSCIIPVALTRSRPRGIPEMAPVGLKSIIKKAPLALIGCTTAGLMSSAFYTMGPIFCQKINLSVSQLSSFMTVVALGGLFFQWPIGTISDRFDRSLVIPVLKGLFAVVSGLMIVAAQSSFGIFMVVSSVFGGLLFSIYPVAVARAHDMFEPKDVVSVSSALLLFYGIGSVLGPVASSTVITLLDSPDGFFVCLTMVSAFSAAVSFALRQREIVKIIPVEDQVDFRIMKHTSQVVLQIDLSSQVEQTRGESFQNRPSTYQPDPGHI